MPNIRTVSCPICRKDVAWLPENRHRPFCSFRCRQIDLGAWADGTYTIPTNHTQKHQE